MRFTRSTLDALSAHVCVLDQRGFILTTNQAWQRFAGENGGVARRVSARANYLQVCDRTSGPDREGAAAFASGIRAVARGERPDFTLEYPCHAPDEQRWFIGRVTRFLEGRLVRLVVAHENITDRKRNELAALHLATIVESSNDAIIGTALDGTVTSWNRGAETIFGYTASEMIGSSILRLIPDDLHREEEEILSAIRAGRSVKHLETRRRTRDGRILGISVTASPILGPGGKIIGISKVARDISARQAAEAALHSSRELLRSVINSTPSFIFATDRDHRYLLANDAYASFAGHSADSIIGRTHHDLYPRDQADVFVADNDAIVARGETRQIAETVLGRELLSVKFPLRDSRGVIFGICGVITDVTDTVRAQAAQRDTEERFRELAENIREVFWMTEAASDKLLYVSPAYERIWGRTCASLHENRRGWIDSIHPDDRDRIAEAAAVKVQRGDYNEMYRIERPDGSMRWIRDRAVPVRGPAGEILHIVGTAEDITEQRQLEEQFRQAQKMEAIGQLAGGVAHDFNNILAVMLGYAELARAGTAEGHPTLASLDQVITAGERARRLVKQILTFSRREPKERRLVHLEQTVTDTAKFLKATLPAMVEMVTTMEDCRPVLADPTQMHQVLFNLCSNAWQALDGKPGRIEISLKPVVLHAAAAGLLDGLRPGRFVRLAVRDDGEGIPEHILPRIFEPFFTTKEAGKGTGLGLSVVHGIVKEHEGSIRVASKPGDGATFEVYLPVADEGFVEAPPGKMPEKAMRQGQRILVLDDEEALVELAGAMLEQVGHVVTGFTRPKDAIEAFLTEPDRFDLVITDLNMPGTSGLDVAAAILQRRPGMPVLLSSGHVSDELRLKAAALGVREVLHKPTPMAELRAAVDRAAAKS